MFYTGDINCNSNLYYSSDSAYASHRTFYKLNNLIPIDIFPYTSSYQNYYLFNNPSEFSIKEIIVDTMIENTKKNALFNSILKKNWIIKGDYNFDSSNNSLECDYMGTIGPYDIEGTKYYDITWLSNYDTLMSDLGTSYMSIYDNGISSTGDSYDTIFNNHYTYTILITHNYHPVITLNEKVELKEQTCPEGTLLGSKECPYKLECKNC